MTYPLSMRPFAAGALLGAALLFPTPAPGAAFLASDVSTWLGPAPAPGQSESLLVIQWPGQSAWAWGFRWDSPTPRQGRDLLLALAGADPRFSLVGGAFISDLRWDADLDGSPEFSFPDYDPATGQYLNYFVNNLQQDGNYNDGAAPAGAHLLPPLGSPYDEDGPGTWIPSNTGVLGRPLAHGSWDGWTYSDGSTSPSRPIQAPAPVPEPTAPGLLAAASACLWRRRR